jgi:hypothetical protein
MPKRKKRIGDLTLQDLRKQLQRREKRVKIKISRLMRKKQTLQNQIGRVSMVE